MFRRRKQCFCFALPPLRQWDNNLADTNISTLISPLFREVPEAEGLQTVRDSKMEFVAMLLFELHPHLLNSLRDYVARPSSQRGTVIKEMQG